MKITVTLSTPDRIEYLREDGHTAWTERYRTEPNERWGGGTDGRAFRTFFDSRDEADYRIRRELDRIGWRERMAVRVAEIRAAREAAQ